MASAPLASTDQPKTSDTPAPPKTDAPAPDAKPAPDKPAASAPDTVTAVTPDAKPSPDKAPQLAPTSSPRPPSRPRPAPPAPDAGATAAADAPAKATDAKAKAAASAPPADTTSTVDQASIDAALAAVTAQDPAASQSGSGGTGDQPIGATLNSGEVDNLHHAIATKWNIGALSTDAAKVIIVVQVTLGQDQKPQAIKMLSFSGGSDGAAQLAFTAARSAIYRAASAGLNLPADKYEDWKDLELTFDPTKGSLR